MLRIQGADYPQDRTFTSLWKLGVASETIVSLNRKGGVRNIADDAYALIWTSKDSPNILFYC